MEGSGSIVFNTSNRENELDRLFDRQWPAIYTHFFGENDDDVLLDAVDELSKKYRQFITNYPSQNFVESPLGKLHVLDFVGALISLYPAKNLNYENRWSLTSAFDRNLSAFYVDENLAMTILEKIVEPEPSYKDIWRTIFKFVGVAHSKALAEHGPPLNDDSDLDDISLSGHTRSASSVHDYENTFNVTAGDEVYPRQSGRFLQSFPRKPPRSRVSGGSTNKSIKSEKVMYSVDELLYKQTGLCVKGETLWAIRSPDDTSFLLRDIWQDEEEVFKELELYRKAKERKVVNLATVIHSEMVMMSQNDREVDSTWYGIRDGLSIPLTQRKLVNVDNDDGLIVYRSKKPPRSLEDVVEYYMPRNPTHFRQVFEFIKPLSLATTLEGIYYGFRDAIRSHQGLGEQASILHRNITPRNIMISQDEKIGYLYGLNGALEFKAFDGSGKNWEWGYVCYRAFVAMELLHTKVYIEHNFYHDLESFFWCFLWEAVHNNGPDSPRQECVDLDCWNTMTCKDLSRAKLTIASNNEFFEELMASKITNFFKPSLPYIRKLRKAIFVESPNYYDPKLYKWMIQIFDDAVRDCSFVGDSPDRKSFPVKNRLMVDTASSVTSAAPPSPITPKDSTFSPISPPSSSRTPRSLKMSRHPPSPVADKRATLGAQRYPSYLRPNSSLDGRIM